MTSTSVLAVVHTIFKLSELVADATSLPDTSFSLFLPYSALASGAIYVLEEQLYISGQTEHGTIPILAGIDQHQQHVLIDADVIITVDPSAVLTLTNLSLAQDVLNTLWPQKHTLGVQARPGAPSDTGTLSIRKGG